MQHNRVSWITWTCDDDDDDDYYSCPFKPFTPNSSEPKNSQKIQIPFCEIQRNNGTMQNFRQKGFNWMVTYFVYRLKSKSDNLP